MTLGDFFTLTEMIDGFKATDRVKELVNAIMEEKDCQLKSAGDATKQWSTVANTIAATEDKECLDLFVQLDGIAFIKKWIEDSQKLDSEPSDSSAEEVITALLHAVEKLHISYEQSVAYGIRETIEKLLSHSSIVVQEKATALFDSWKLGAEDIVEGLSGEGIIKPNIEVTLEEKHAKTDDEVVQNICSVDVLPVKEDGTEIHTNNDEKTLHHENLKNEEAIIMKPFEENLCNEGEHLPCHLEGTPSSASTAAVSNEDGVVFNQFSGNKEQTLEVGNPPDKLDAMEVSPSLMKKGSEPVTGSDLQTDTVVEGDYNPKDSDTRDMITDKSPSPVGNSGIHLDDTQPIPTEANVVSQNEGRDCDNKVLDNSGNGDRSPKLASLETSSRGDSDSSNGDSSSGRGLTNETNFLKTETKDSRMAKKNMSDFELNYGMVDALEVARQVAIEVKREVEGQTESSCSSSPKEPDTEIKQPNSSASVHRNKTQIDECASTEDSPKEEVLPNELGIDSSQVPNGEVESESKPNKGIIDFDLNQDICPDDMEQPVETSIHASTVSASRAAAAPGFPVSPLEFEGAHGWKGSAATSAFRPASPRKVHDSDKTDSDPKHQRNFLDFDLNMSEDGDDKPVEMIPQKKTFHSGESSGEVSRLNLDLNRISDEGDAPPSDWRITERLLFSRNNHHNASPSSSSSSMQQPTRNFDLNDQPSLLNDSSELPFFSKLSSSGNSPSSIGAKSNSNVISIMGAKVEVSRKDIFPQPNGRILEPGHDVNLTRSGGGVLGIGSAVRYPHPSMFPYNGHGPTGNFSQVMYGPNGPIPYMVDSRVPQLLGSTSAPVPYSQPPFPNAGVYGMMHPPGFSSSGPSRPKFDLNLGLMSERVNRESGVLRQFLGPGQDRSLDEPRSSFQPSSLGKRKEPDGGLWESYPLDYKHHHPQWK